MRCTCCVLLLAIAVALGARAQSTNLTKRAMSLRDCIQRSLQNNLDIRIERYSTDIAGYRLRAAYGAYDPLLNLYARRSFIDQPARINPDNLRLAAQIGPGGQLISGSVIDTQNEFEMTMDGGGGGFTGKIPTGMSYELLLRSDYRDITAYPLPGQILPVAVTNDNYAQLSFMLQQPLLKNLWIDAERLTIQLAKKDLKISQTTFRGQMMTNVTDVMIRYYEVLFAREAVRVQQKAYELAKQLYTETRRRVQVGELPPLSEKQTESLMETVLADLTAAEQINVAAQNALKQLLAENIDPWIDVEIEPTDVMVAVEEVVDRQASWQAAILNRPDLEELRLELEKKNLLVRYYNNQRYPDLSLYGGAGFQAYQEDLSGAWRTVRDGSDPFYSVGIKLTFPIPNTTAKNQYRASLAAKDQAELKVKRKEIAAATDVDTAVKGVESAYKRVQSTRKASMYAEDALAAEEKKFRTGASTSFLVQEYQRNLTAARTAEVRALADYHQAKARLRLEEGTTLSKNQISVSTK